MSKILLFVLVFTSLFTGALPLPQLKIKEARAAGVRLFPSAAGTYDQWSFSGCAASWQCVSEDPHDSDASFIETSFNNRRASFNLPDGAVPASAVINKIKINAFARKTAAQDASLVFFYRKGGSNTEGQAKTISSAVYEEFEITQTFFVNWSLADLNGLEIGALSSNPRAQRITQMSIDVTYSLPLPAGTQTTLFPTGQGYYTGWDQFDCVDPDDWQCVDEDPHDNDNSYVFTNTNNLRESFALPDNAVPINALITDITVIATMRKMDTRKGFVTLFYRDTSTATNIDGTKQSVSENYAEYQEIWNGFNWDVGKLNALEIGVMSSNGTVYKRLTQIRVIVTYSLPYPDITSVNNASEPSLSDGGRVNQTIQVNGSSFGSSCAPPSYRLEIGTYIVGCEYISFWSNVQIIFSIPPPITVYGGAGSDGLNVVANGQDSVARATFYVYPDITSLTTPSVANSAREYDASDTDGVITLNGTRFGTNGTVSVLGVVATVDSFTDTAVQVRVPASIADDAYTGSIVVTRATPADSKTDTWSAFRVLPRITSLVPDNGLEGDTVQVNGNHFCQTGACPGVGSRSTALDNVKFYDNVQVPDGDVSAWSHAQITVKVPIGAISGNVVARSNNYNSNGKYFTVNVPTPNDPTDLRQFKTDQITEILIGEGSNETEVRFRMTMSATIPGTLYPQVEVKPIGTAFDETGVVEGTGVSYSGTPVEGWAAVTGLIDGTSYHWRARVRRAPSFYSNWVSYGGNNDPNDVDFYIDTSPPTFYLGTDGTCSTAATNITDTTAAIVWSTSDATSGAPIPPGPGGYATTQVQYIKTADFTDWTSTPGTLSTLYPRENSPHNVIISDLLPATSYTYRMRSKDSVDNEGFSHTGSGGCALTTSAARPIKTVEKFISQETAASAGAVLTYNWSMYIPESPGTTISIKSAFIEIVGISDDGTQTIKAEIKQGTLDGTSYNDGGAAAFALDAVGAGALPFVIYFDVLNPTGSPPNCSACAGLSNITTGGANYEYTLYLKGTAVPTYVLGAKLILTYSYIL